MHEQRLRLFHLEEVDISGVARDLLIDEKRVAYP
jgi:hypothetical protein